MNSILQANLSDTRFVAAVGVQVDSIRSQTMTEQELEHRLDRIETLLTSLIDSEAKKEYYTTGEIAKILSRAEWTVREWCRLGRVWAEKRECGRGVAKEWMISHVELTRIRNEGLLPL